MISRTTGWLIIAAFAALLLGALSGCSAPTRAKVVSLEKPYKPAQTGARSSYHRVRKGDTLYTIAWRYGLDLSDLASWNNIRPPYTIFPGQSLRLSYPPKQAARPRPDNRPAPARPSAATAEVQPSAKTAAPQATVKPAVPAARPAVTEGYQERTELHWQWPTNGKLEQRFSNVDPSRKGIKISGSSGQQVVAAESGKVVYAGSGLIGYGRLIIIKHNKIYLSAYGHNRKLLVQEGAVVKKGEPLAEMGKNGDGRPTLHFEIRRNGTPVNPIKLLPRRR